MKKFPGRSSTNHSIVVSGDPRFAGTIKNHNQRSHR
ncbi:hypothetical protein HTY54_28265 [Escherichia coli]|nr:hypothetical protein [Escherichia coli]